MEVTPIAPEVSGKFSQLVSLRAAVRQEGRCEAAEAPQTAVKGQTGAHDIIGGSRENCVINLEETSQETGGKVEGFSDH